jgi:hypothetical protein
MDITEYRSKARAYVRQTGRKPPTEIYESIGSPPSGYRLKADGKGNVTTEAIDVRKRRQTKAETKRKEALNLRRAQTKQEQNQVRRQNYARTAIRKRGGSVVIDHVIDLSLLADTVRGMTPEEVKRHIEKLEKVYGPLGDRPQNRRIIGEYTNEIKRQQSKSVQKALKQMETKSPSKSLKLTKPNKPKLQIVNGSVQLSFFEGFDMLDEPSVRMVDTGPGLPIAIP